MGTPQAQFADAAAARPVRAAAPRHRGRAERPRRGAGTDADGAAPGADPAESVRDLEKDKVSGPLREPDTWLAVKCQDVVSNQVETGDGCGASDTVVRSMSVVVV